MAHLAVPPRNCGRHVFVRLELDDEIHSLADEVLRVPEGHLGLIAVVENEQLHALPLRVSMQARRHLARE